jgi:hypothetical protein
MPPVVTMSAREGKADVESKLERGLLLPKSEVGSLLV